jgi:DNA-binding PucR family transcriptional regulator
MTVQDALAAAEQLLPGQAAPDGAEDLRWQAIIEVAMFAENEPDAIWPFVLKWGSHEDEDVRAAVATCLLEDLLQYHFDIIFPRVESAARSNACFGKTAAQCWKFGQAKELGRAQLFDRLVSDLRRMDS